MENTRFWLQTFIFLQTLSEISKVWCSLSGGEGEEQALPGLGAPYFQDYESGSTINVTTQLGSATYLHCKVNRLGGKTVSWMRRSTREDDNPYLLTYGRLIYSSDARYQIFHEAGHDWKLQIQFTRLSDEGLYECRVSSKTALVQYTYLKVVVPEIKIMDERNSMVKDQIIYEGGSTIELKCVVTNLVGEQPEYIIWKKEDRMLNYDLERGGISVETNLMATGATSKLKIKGARYSDSGNYTCTMMGMKATTSVELNIQPGKNAQPIMDDGGNSCCPPLAPVYTTLLILLIQSSSNI
ncbi:cell adhesion molecule 4 [Eurytemora carolleeae]|uniref:cell adhesion molecule 4 n=1 Tax=Eurytemora carolleeae TaxID=1294199 RepID=UPI000C75D0C6|nr:cell adhesion molecule 4 [Eurytemora carolleeae]|eukprot:XP_023332483.1 cell adhesion molecule 4-like [Eurytemora affinis]